MTDNNVSKAEIDKLAKHLKNEYDPNKKTRNGQHTKYAECIATALDDLHLGYKPKKGVSVKVAGVRIRVDQIDEEDLQNVVDNFQSLLKLSKKLPAEKKASKPKNLAVV